MLATIRHFSEDEAGQPISRFAYRIEMNALEDDLRARMAEAIGERGTAMLWPFPSRQPPGLWDPTSAICGGLDPASPVHSHPTPWAAGGDIPFRSTFQNVIGRIPGTNPGQGKYVICSHFDAIGARTPDWRGWIDPAPGADDNLSGTAAVLELARILSAEPPLPFDLEFVCFDGEELGLWGSDTLAHADRAAGAPILGVFNMDMIGYNPRSDSLVVMTNRSSWYLGDYVRETEALTPQPELTFRLAIDNLLNSDHGPYWSVGYPGLMLIESLQIVRHNPQYHQIIDRPATISRNGQMMGKAANIYLKTLRRLAAASTAAPELRVSETDLIVSVNGAIESRIATPGDDITIEAGIFNTGGDTEGAPISVSFFLIDNAGARHLLESRVVTTPIRTGGHLRVPFSREATAADIGAMTIEMEVDDGSRISTARRAIPVRGTMSRVVSHYMAPNPVRTIEQAAITYELSLDATVRITLFDMHGAELGKQYYRYEVGTRATNTATGTGQNRVELRELLAGQSPAPGIYLYRIEVFPDGEVEGNAVLGKFAILH
ncbi:MAG: M28 family metallopeptidase [Candidatus Eisenbacteria bacterium]|nr:M28 family metallopeptidase [Candidatus Eisenbacteria bacterium]